MITLSRISHTVVVAGAVALAACSSSSSSSTETTTAKVESARNDAAEKLEKSAQLVTELSEKVTQGTANRAKCVIAIPSLAKGGFIVGGQGGSGYATCQTANGWSAPAPISIGGGTVGLQIGGESTDLLALVTSDKAMKALETGNFKVGVDASASAGPVGTGRGTGTDIAEGGDLLTYSRSKGLFAGANLNGTSIKADGDAVKVLYGQAYELSAILEGRVAAPNMPASQRFLSAVSNGFGTKRGSATSMR